MTGSPRDGGSRGASTLPGLNATSTTPRPRRVAASIADGPGGDRQRQVRRLATIELAGMLYGPAADLHPAPPGPAACPADCGPCSGRRAA